jgi:hypothetical protein
MSLRSDEWPPISGGWRSFAGVLLPADEVIAAFAREGIVGHLDERPDSKSDEFDIHSFVEDLAREGGIPPPAEVFVFPDGKRFRGFEPSSHGVYLYWPEEAWMSSGHLRKLLSACRAYGPMPFKYRVRYHIRPLADLVIWFVICVVVVWLAWARGG